ncbi:MAG: UDP-N-acetylmuramoyl-L-alanyl-D-glutamate--2,6-diaminopimelate ligase [Bacteroidetes bacterium]|nr:MAG: UDP-N-acetylmuramoyl-L-alanyl-D-glutamate--2,6-diaminopimelate ligase [Bacteroidota bacterium]
MRLGTLLTELTYELAPQTDPEVHRIDFDSRRVQPGSLFVAVAGTQVDGHQYIEQALAAGAVAIVAERQPITATERSAAAWVVVPDSAAALGHLASAFYGHPSGDLQLVGVTGTNGKTTVATLLYQLFQGLGYKTGLLSTVENRIGETIVEATHTTPDAVRLNALLAEMLTLGCEYVFMEVSSHAVAQGRIAGLHFKGGVFTNMSRDHLDYHGSFKAYIAAKKKFFDTLPKSAFALVNIDDKRGEVMVQNTRAKIKRYSLRSLADYRARILANTAQGLHLMLDRQEVFTRLIGDFNAYNLLAVYGVADLLGQPAEEVLPILSMIPGPVGRATYLQDPQGRYTAVVDYAHTPDAVEKICRTLRQILRPGQRLLTVVGCGGDRDPGKRPLMAQAAVRNSDEVIFTSDNPRSEDPELIIDQMEAGLSATERRKVLRITDRRAAIQTACRLAQAGDIILVAGKGHETYQEIKGVKYPFDDTALLHELLHHQSLS